MTHEQMTVHKALSELKVMDSKIEKAIEDASYIVSAKKSAEKINGVSVEKFKNTIKSDWQKINDLLARRDAMKRAVVLSNATTTVTINGKEYTVAEAIEMKNHGMEWRNVLIRKIGAEYDKALVDLNRNDGEAIEKKAEQYVLAMVQAQPKESKVTVDSDAMKMLRQTYIDNNSFVIIDPLDIKDKMEELRNEVLSFYSDVDSALSVSNALTVIEFDY